MATLDDTAFGAASDVTPKFVSPSDPAAQWTGAMRGPAFFAYADNYLIDVKFGIIMDVEASRAIRQAEVGAAKTMIERTEERFGMKPERLAADTAYGSAANLNWLVNAKQIAPHIPVIDKSKREDGTFSREDFTFDKARDVYICPAGEVVPTTGTVSTDHAMRYIAPVPVCRACPLKPRCCPNMPARRIVRDVNEDARDVARTLAKTEAFEQSCRDRKRVEMLFAHLKRILRLGRLRLRGPRGAQDEFTLAAIAQNLRRLGKLVARPPPQGRGVRCVSVACVSPVRPSCSHRSERHKRPRLVARKEKAKPGRDLTQRQRARNRRFGRVRAKVEHIFRIVKCQFGYRKVRYRGIAKNGAQVFALLALANLYLVRGRLASAA